MRVYVANCRTFTQKCMHLCHWAYVLLGLPTGWYMMLTWRGFWGSVSSSASGCNESNGDDSRGRCSSWGEMSALT